MPLASSSTRILGVVLVRNEDRFLEQALKNASAFCDQFLLFDHRSEDGSAGILREFAARHGDARWTTIRHPSESHKALSSYAGQDLWVFGVDGDEIYDPAGLVSLRERICAGEFQHEWMLMGHCLHTEELDFARSLARGFLAPPSRSITKLYNFRALESWGGKSQERLHGGTPVFRPGYHADRKRLLFGECSWDESPLRCLHVCFCNRSTASDAATRKNIDEIYNRRLPAWMQRVMSRLPVLGRSVWKKERYRRGPRVELSTAPFFP